MASPAPSSPPEPTAPPKPQRKLYFINEIVEDLLRRYIWTGCTRVALRDQIMSHANELIKQIIRKQGLHTIYPGQEESSFGDLTATAWMQIERTLYKFRARPHCRACYLPERPNDSVLYQPGKTEYGIVTYEQLFTIIGRSCPHCDARLSHEPEVAPAQDLYGGSESVMYRGISKVFNMWSQVARTVILAFIKKEGRDRKNQGAYRDYIGHRSRPPSDAINRFMAEAGEIFRHDDSALVILQALRELASEDDRPHEGTIAKLVDRTGLPRTTVTKFIRVIRLRSHEFTDSLINRETSQNYQGRKRFSADDEE